MSRNGAAGVALASLLAVASVVMVRRAGRDPSSFHGAAK